MDCVIISNVLAGDTSLWGRGQRREKRRATPNADGRAATDVHRAATAQPSDAEKGSALNSQRKRALLAASTAAAISWAGTMTKAHFLFPHLYLVSVPLTLAAALPIFRDTTVALQNQQMDVAVVSAVALIGSMLLQQTTVAALIDVAHYSGQAAIEWWQKREAEATQSVHATAQSLLADSDVYFVRCWQEDGSDAQPVTRYVLEAQGDAARHGFTKLTDLIEALRGKMVAPQGALTPVAVLAN